MTRPASLGKQDQSSALKALERRAKAVLKARPAYREMVDFYLTVFRRQIEWRDRLVVHPEEVPVDRARECLRAGVFLVERYDPGLVSDSLCELWDEMKDVFGHGNDVLREAVGKIDHAEKAGDFDPAVWLVEQRPGRRDLITRAARGIGVEESMLASLARAVTFPHWKRVAEEWLTPEHADGWRRFRCPTCGGVPMLVENRTGHSDLENLKAAVRRYMHCAFCGSRWVVPALECPACGSTKAGDAKYLFSSGEPELRIDFCASCHRYVKVVDGDKIGGPVHVGLELLTGVHLDVLAQEKNLAPLEIGV